MKALIYIAFCLMIAWASLVVSAQPLMRWLVVNNYDLYVRLIYLFVATGLIYPK